MVVSDMVGITPSLSADRKPRKRAKFLGLNGFKTEETRWLVSFFCVIAIVCIDFVGVTIQAPLLPFYVREFEDAKDLDMGFASALLALSYSISQLIATPIFGCGSDRFGRRPMLLLSVIGGGICFLAQGFAVSFKMLCILRFVTGLFGGSRPVAAAYIGDAVPIEEQPKWFGISGVGVSMSLFMSPAFGGSMGMISLALPCFFMAGVSAILAAVSLVYVLEPEHKSSSATTAATKTSQAGGAWKFWLAVNAFVGAASMYLNVSWGNLFPTFAYTRLNLDQNTIGLIMGGGGLMIAVSQIAVFVPLSKRIRIPIIGCLGLLLSAAPCGFLVLPDQVWYAVVASCAYGFGSALVGPGVMLIVNMLSPESRRGSNVSLTLMAQGLARILGPLVGGPLYDIKYSFPFIVMLAVCILALILESLLILRITVIGKKPVDKKKEISKEELQEEEDKKDILENLYKVHHQLTMTLKEWHAKRNDLQLGKSAEELGLPTWDSIEPEIAEGQKSLLGFWMADMLSAHGYKSWPDFLPLIQSMCKNAFPKIRHVEWKSRTDDIVYILQSHLMLEQRWERFVLSHSDLADSPEYHLDDPSLVEQQPETCSEVHARNSAKRADFENISFTLSPDSQIAYV